MATVRFDLIQDTLSGNLCLPRRELVSSYTSMSAT